MKITAYMSYNKEDNIRLKSSSGGIFYSLAKYILDNNGIVFGAKWAEDWLVDMCYINKSEDLPKLMGSKYVKANNKNTFKECQNFLDQGKLVLYSGTPCQIMALKTILGKDYSNLYTIAIACYGTTPIQIWKDYLEGIKRPNCKIIDIKMRDKTGTDWNNYNYVIEYSDGKKLIENHLKNKYSKLFISGNYFNKVCYNCKAKENNMADISLGDYWGVKNKFLNIEDKKGISFVLTYNEKGDNLIKKLKDIYIEKTDIDHIKKFNKGIQTNLNKNLLTYKNDVFRKKVAIITMNMHFNIGTALQAYALQTVLKRKGYDSEIITWERKDRLKFCDKYLKMRILPSAKDYNKIKEDEYDIFIVGSDQIWRKNTSKNDYKENYINYPFLKFTNNWNKVRFSYAASFGLGGKDWAYDTNENLEIKDILRQFNSISVREFDSVNDINNKLQLNAVQLCDPTMLLDKLDYENLCSDIKISNFGIFKYFLHETDEKRHFIDDLNKKLHLNVVEYDKTSVIDWLTKIRDSKLIVTDSFHGVVFSIIFNKPFLFYNTRDSGKIRFDTLNKLFNINSKLINDKLILNHTIFNPLNIDLNLVKSKAYEYLDYNLKDVPKKLTVVNSSYDPSRLNKLNWQTDNKHAWILFLSTDNYLYYVLNVYKSLIDVGTKYAVCCACTDNLSQKTMDILNKCGIITFVINTSNILKDVKLRKIRNWVKAFPKLEILRNQLHLDKMVYLDSDLGIYENIDELMNKPHMSAVPDGAPLFNRKPGPYHIGDSIFCSGLFVWDFKGNSDGEKLLSGLKNLPKNIDWHDQNVLNYFYSNWINDKNLHLNYTYGLMTTIPKFDYVKPTRNVNWPKVIHYIAGQGEKTKMPFINEACYLQSWCSMPIVKEYYTEINNNVKKLMLIYKFNLPLINVDNIKNSNGKKSINSSIHVVSRKTVLNSNNGFTGLPEEYWKDNF